VPTGTDSGRGHDPVVVRRLTSPKDPALVAARAAGLQVAEGRFTLEKYWHEVKPENLYEVIELSPNLFLTAGITEVLKLATGAAATAFNSTNARLCVGDSSTAASAGQTDLQAATNKFRQLVDGTPTVVGNTATFVATFAAANANFAWNEVGVANASSGGAMWSRTVQALGTKASPAVWVLSWALSIS
jgi:hypothetical protein